MGLAPYGTPRYYDLIMSELLSPKEDGSYKMAMRYFGYVDGLRMINEQFDKLFGRPPREPESVLEQFHKHVAASVQKVTNELMVRMARHLYAQTKTENLCLAGGVALNCVANSRILAETPFRNIFIQPAAGDAGGAVGVAYYIYNTILKNERNFRMEHAFLGPEYSDFEISSYLDGLGVPYRKLEGYDLLRETARLINEQNVVGWFQGRMEWGPRALGNRSILADARNPENQSKVNLKIKFRESFRPFAPAVIAEKSNDYFELDQSSPYMLLTAQVREDRRHIPAVTHVDGSARLQTVSKEQNPLFYELLNEFDRQTGCPVVINTSMNVRGEPIVCSPHDAFKCFIRTEMDYLVMGSYLLSKADFTARPEGMVFEEFELD